MKPLTTKQRQLLKVIVLGNLDVKGDRISNVDYQQIMNRIPYTCTRESIMCSIRILKDQGWIVLAGKELRSGRMKQTVEPTAMAIRVITPPVAAKVPEYVEVEIDDDRIELVLE